MDPVKPEHIKQAIALDVTNVDQAEARKRADAIVELLQKAEMPCDPTTLVALLMVVASNGSDIVGQKDVVTQKPTTLDAAMESVFKMQGGAVENTKTGEKFFMAPAPKTVH